MPPTLESRHLYPPRPSELPSTRSTATASCAWPSPRRASRSPPPPPTSPPRSRWRARRPRSRRCSRVFPELGLSAYSNEDLFQQDALLDASVAALRTLLEASQDVSLTFAVGLPLRHRRPPVQLRGPAAPRQAARRRAEDLPAELPRVLREDGSSRPARRPCRRRSGCSDRRCRSARACCSRRPTCRLRAAHGDLRGRLGAAAAEHARGDGRRDRRRQPLGQRRHGRQGRLPAPAVRVAIGEVRRGLPVLGRRPRRVDDRPRLGRSRADLRERRASRRIDPLPARWAATSSADIDLDHLRQERMRWTTFGDCAQAHRAQLQDFRRVEFELDVPPTASRCGGASSASRTCRPIRRDATSAAPRSTTSRSTALRKRLAATGIKRVVLGISGGLDSTQAALVAVRAFDRLGLPRKDILGYTLPGFGTSRQTFENAHALMRSLGITPRRDRHPAVGGTDAAAHRPPVRRRPAGPRRHVRKRAGRRAHLAPVPAREPQGRDRARHGRPVGTRARLHDLRRRRPHVALQRERVGPEDADPAPGPLADRDATVRCGHARRADAHRRHADLARTRSRRGRQARAVVGSRRRARTSCRTSTSTTSAGSATGRARSRSSLRPRGATRARARGPTPCRSRSDASTTSRRSATGSKCSCAASSKAASSSAPPCRTAPRSVRADRCRRAATGVRRAIRPRRRGSTNCTPTCRLRCAPRPRASRRR